MNKVQYIFIAVVTLLLSGCQTSDTNLAQNYTTQSNNTNTKQIPWPPSTSEQKRYIINLPEISNPQEYEIELVIGKEMEVDTCNQFNFAGNIETKTLDGWGYNYYVAYPTRMSSTRRACLNNKKVKKFIQMYDRNQSRIKYNSKLPIVVYTPKDFQVSYKLWKQGHETHSVPSQ